MGDLHMSFPLDEAYDPQDGGYDEVNGDHYDSYEYEDYDNDGYDDGFYETECVRTDKVVNQR